MTKNKSQATNDSVKVGEQYRLPCRGCTSACGNYAICEGRPWRTLSENKQAS